MAARLDDREIREISALSKLSHLDKSVLVKQLIRTGLFHHRLELALEKYRKREVSLGKAAEIAGVGVWELLTKFSDYDITLNYDEQELERDLEGL